MGDYMISFCFSLLETSVQLSSAAPHGQPREDIRSVKVEKVWVQLGSYLPYHLLYSMPKCVTGRSKNDSLTATHSYINMDAHT